MDLGELQVFLMVAKEGSFSRAAERLYRTQPAISLGIRKLEDSLGQPLFVRGSRPVRLTDAGTLLKEYAERLLNLRDEVKKGLTELEGLKRGELSLGVNESSIHALLPALAKFRNAHPGVQVRVHRMFSRDIPHEVLNYRLDVGAVSYVPREAQLQATEIVKDELVLVVPLKHPLAKKPRSGYRRSGQRDLCRAHRGIAVPQARHRVVCAASRDAEHADRNADHRKHQALRADGHGRGHRAAHVRAVGNRARLDERSEGAADEHATSRVSGFAAWSALAACRRRTYAHSPRRVAVPRQPTRRFHRNPCSCWGALQRAPSTDLAPVADTRLWSH